MNANYNLRNVERFTRFLVGFSLVLMVLVLPLSSKEIIFLIILSFYPLVTALIAVDPVLNILEKISSDSTLDEEVTLSPKLLV